MKKKLAILLFVLMLWIGTVSALTYMNAVASNNYYIDVSLVNQMPDPVEPGQIVEVRFKFDNWGSETAQDISVEILPEFPFSLSPGESAVKSIGSIQARQNGDDGVIVKYKLKVDEKAVEGENELELRYNINQAGYASTWVKLDPFNIDVQTHDSIISIESVDSEPKTLAPGQEGMLSIEIKNMADSLLKEIKAKLEVRYSESTATSITTTEYPFSPIGSTNEKTIYQLMPGKTAVIEFNIIADPGAESNVYKVPLTIEYSDELGQNYTKNLIVGMVIGEEPDMAINLEETTIQSAGMKGTATVKFINKGTSDIKFCYVTLKESEDYDIIGRNSDYIGKIDSDDYETTDFEIYVDSKKSEVKLQLLVEYKDANNNDYSKNVELPLKIYSSGEAKKYGITQGSSSVGMIIVVIIVGVGLFFYWRQRKKRKK